MIQEETTQIYERLIAATGDVIAANLKCEPLAQQLRQAEEELETQKQLAYAELLVQGKAGPLTASNAEGREAQFITFLKNLADGEPYKVADSKVKKLSVEVMNAKLDLQNTRTKLDSMKSLCDLQVARLNYESQLLAVQVASLNKNSK